MSRTGSQAFPSGEACDPPDLLKESCGLFGPERPGSVRESVPEIGGVHEKFGGGHLKPVTLKPVIRISAFSAFSCPHFPYFPRLPRFCSSESPQTLVFLWREGLSAFSAFSPYRFRIADFENPTDRL